MNPSALPPGGGPDNASNFYAAQHEEAVAQAQACLDASAPRLQSMGAARLNRRALVFMLGMVGLLLAVIYLALRGNGSGESGAPTGPEERVEVPDAPTRIPEPAAAAGSRMAAEPAVQRTTPADVLPVPVPMPQPPLPADIETLLATRGAGSLVQRRRGQALDEADVSAVPAVEGGERLAGLSAAGRPSPVRAATVLDNAAYRLLRGTYIRCVLETRITTDLEGFTACVVSEPVYSFNGRRLLLPAGSRVLGQYGSGAVRGKRVAVVWDRIITPAGIDIPLSSPGIDTLGSAGHPGRHSAHWAQRISSALLISLLSDAFKYYGEKDGPASSTSYPAAGAVVQSPYQSNTARTLQGLAGQAVRESANRPATVTLAQGSLINILVAQDVDFSTVLRP
ncbi:TrbI/VirB10 family protein [Stenotrophomonas sp. C3(2023)]|uniref:TrbI/VirB10 family protein n=1 Tax=Stenotrophomonas sp. C3(2023) TaxID=3080277 RepID=UPI00293C784D|nr:TrbI/VirB10 family protein [Stenotrophomonas sp. C3(2023)]MDV3468441.1 TrbI/VirB10 family protein [Stenotrophomonas sp. C3(2023)]